MRSIYRQVRLIPVALYVVKTLDNFITLARSNVIVVERSGEARALFTFRL